MIKFLWSSIKYFTYLINSVYFTTLRILYSSKGFINSANISLLAFQDFDKDESSKVAVLYGVGGNFCAGYDLEEVSKKPPVHLSSYGQGPMVSYVTHC